MIDKCDYEQCPYPDKTLGVSVIWDHGKRYHPDCYGKACREKMEVMVKKTAELGYHWSMGKYET